MYDQLYKRNKLITFGLFFVILSLLGGLVFLTYTSLETQKYNNKTIEDFLLEKEEVESLKDSFSKISDSAKLVLPEEATTSLIFQNIGQIGENYNLLVSNFAIATPDKDLNPTFSEHIQQQTITLDTLGTQNNTKEFVRRIEELVPLIEVDSFTLTTNEEGLALTSFVLHTFYKDLNLEVISTKEDLSLEVNKINKHPLLDYLFPLDEIKQISPNNTE